MGIKQPQQKIYWVSGKGGVGKSTVAAAQALAFARKGHRTLLVELGEKSFYRRVFDRDIDHQPTQVGDDFFISRWDGEDCLKEYLLHLFRVEKIVNLFFENKVTKSLLQAAPGLKELSILGKITSGVRGVGPTLNFDRIVVDAYSTGHFQALIKAPPAMAEAIPFGPMGEQSHSIIGVLKDPRISRYAVVTIPEELPVTEGLELAAFLRAQDLPAPRFILNRHLDLPFGLEDLQPLRQNDFVVYLETLLRRQNEFESRLKSAASPLETLKYSWKPSAIGRIQDLAEAIQVEEGT